MARRATTKAAAPKATTAKTPVEQPVVSTAEIQMKLWLSAEVVSLST